MLNHLVLKIMRKIALDSVYVSDRRVITKGKEYSIRYSIRYTDRQYIMNDDDMVHYLDKEELKKVFGIEM